jgi:hypothetical protein
MKNNLEHNISSEEQRRNRIVGLAIGAALGMVFWSALDNLLPFPLDLIVGMGTGLITGYQLGKQPIMLMRFPPVVLGRVLFAGAIAISGMIGYRYLLDLELTNTQQILASMVAIIPAIVFVFAIGSAISHLDEMQRRIQTEGIAIAFAGTAMVMIAFALLGFAGVPNPNVGILLLVMIGMWVFGKLWTMWRYR